MLEIELWEYIKIKGNKTKYQVSFSGKVRNAKTGKLIKPYINNSGYLKVSLYYDGKQHKKYVHQLVAQAFVTNPDPFTRDEVNHNDGNKLNNEASNLEWVTHKENMEHAVKTGLKPTRYGEDCPLHKHSESTVTKICEMLENGYRVGEIAKILNIKKPIISMIKHRKRWTSVSYKYNF